MNIKKDIAVLLSFILTLASLSLAESPAAQVVSDLGNTVGQAQDKPAVTQSGEKPRPKKIRIKASSQVESSNSADLMRKERIVSPNKVVTTNSTSKEFTNSNGISNYRLPEPDPQLLKALTSEESKLYDYYLEKIKEAEDSDDETMIEHLWRNIDAFYKAYGIEI